MEKKFDDLVLPNKKDTTIMKIVGIVTMVLTCGAGLFLWYGPFCDRENYYNRKALYKYIKKNGIPTTSRDSIFSFGDIEIIVSADRWFGHNVAEHENVICSFCADVFDRRRYKAIDAILRAAT